MQRARTVETIETRLGAPRRPAVGAVACARLEAPGALRRMPHEAHAGETWHMALCWAGARVPANFFCVICVHTRLAAGALVELGAENSRMSEYGGVVN